MFPGATQTYLTGEQILIFLYEHANAHGENLQRSMAPPSSPSLGFLTGRREPVLSSAP